ncbi:MAG: Sua5/YciO/YrdC/YwlC family protein [Desulfovibrionaceae bacterium]|nr:Sua5/YciO/YrdC/YwlC family protein [Desulfovibrionaceae bacterium]
MDALRISEIISSGGVVVYPTETLYALGCDAFDAWAAARVARIKGRLKDKPLPVIIAGLDWLDRIAAEVPQVVLDLAADFWPGPLSVLVRARPELPDALKDDLGRTSVRWTPHASAAEICRLADAALVATSANRSGRAPAATPGELDPDILAQADGALLDRPWPGGGPPSTVVSPMPGRKGRAVFLVRAGAVPPSALRDKGYLVEPLGRGKNS